MEDVKCEAWPHRGARCAELEAEVERLKAGVWVRAVTYHADREYNAQYHDDEYGHSFVVQAFTEDPGEYSHEHGTPDQFRVKVPIDQARTGER
jgi:hypothetical protein